MTNEIFMYIELMEETSQDLSDIKYQLSKSEDNTTILTKCIDEMILLEKQDNLRQEQYETKSRTALEQEIKLENENRQKIDQLRTALDALTSAYQEDEEFITKAMNKKRSYLAKLKEIIKSHEELDCMMNIEV